MRYRKLSPTGDYTFGSGQADFYINSPEAVAQAVKTRLLLFEGEWFLDSTEGTPYFQQVIGFNTQGTRDQAIRKRILDTQGVTAIVSYSSSFSAGSRNFSVSAVINTQYGQAALSV